jgi:class 3 adenylate cyclase
MKKKNTRILIAEDENLISIDIKRALEKLGYTVTSIATTANETLKKIEKDEPDLVLLDIMLKGDATGINAARKIREKYDIPLVYLTALADDETLNEAKQTEPYGYIMKPFDEKVLHSTIELALYKFKTEKELRQKSKNLEEEKLKNENLLYSILPKEIVKELKLHGNIEPRYFERTTILFTDFCGFADLSADYSPEMLLTELNEIFHKFDTIIEKYGLEKLKTVGDIYMIGGGLPKETNDHAIKVVAAAVEMYNYVQERNKNSATKWNMRAGINSGNVVAGIVGNNKFCYDVWGDTVNIASRIESICEPGKINISEKTYELIKDFYECEYSGELVEQGIESVNMYSIKSIKGSLTN